MHTQPKGPIRFETERLIGREWTEADVPAAFAMYSDPEVQAGLSGITEPTIESQRENLRKVIEAYRNRPIGTGYWALERKLDGIVVGATIVKPIPGDEEKVEVGWHMARAYWGKGYATEAAQEAIRIGFQYLPVKRLFCLVRPWNVRSLRVAEKLGFERIGLTTAYYNNECVLLELTRSRAETLGLTSSPADAK